MKFDNQRNQMVESQLRANLVIDESILEAFRSVQREKYFPDDLQSVSYIDDTIYLNKTRFVLRPFVLGKLISNLNLGADKNVLDVGSSNGYSVAILAKLFKKVTCIEEDDTIFDSLVDICKEQKLQNVKIIKQNFLSIELSKDTFDNILVNGEINSDPLNLINSLKIGGKLVAIFRQDAVSYAVTYLKNNKNTYDKIRTFDASASLLINYKSKDPVFSF
jgi:protein-L-isoaspartate(D-aspartate) O-methyltransferase